MTQFSTPIELSDAYTILTSTFKTGLTKSLAWRKWQLKQLFWMIYNNEPAIAAALHKDLHRHDFESYYADIDALKKDILMHLAHVEEWSTDEYPNAGFVFGTLCKARIRKEPRGVALIIGAWNFPYVVTMMPLVAAVSAGCCVLVKPSEMAAASQDLMKGLVNKYLDQRVTGGPKETTLILDKKFNHNFYTGSPNVGRIVQVAAAKHITPTVLELGGQAPAIVMATADVDVAARRILFSKFLNGGQICLSTNHVIVDPQIHDRFVERVTFWLDQFLKGEGKSHMTRIINERNYDRIAGLLKATKGKVVRDSLMSEEIFGPLLPVIKADYCKAYQITNNMEHPLGLYIFSRDQKEIDEILTHSTSGGVTVNDVMLHAGIPNAPFGGVGNSGHGFDAFTHLRTVVSIPSWFEYLLGFRYPPYDKKHIGKLNSRKEPSFKRGEGIEDQKVGGGRLGSWIKTGAKWGALVVALWLLDAKMGGDPKIVEFINGIVRTVTGG